MSSLVLALAFPGLSEGNIQYPDRNLRWIEILGVLVGNINWLELGLGLKSEVEIDEGWGRKREGDRVILVIWLA